MGELVLSWLGLLLGSKALEVGGSCGWAEGKGLQYCSTGNVACAPPTGVNAMSGECIALKVVQSGDVWQRLVRGWSFK